ncbi:MAG: hypothetical protein KKD17_03590 [Nanoarchaeota archaeon]|nr:hypothetical protein [Nanoarchaeota archaeon]
MLNPSDIDIIVHLRSDGRKKATEISRELGMPVNTLYGRLEALKRQAGIRHTALVDFHKIGYKSDVYMGFKVGTSDRDALQEHLERHPALNSLYRVNHGFNFLAHLVFQDIDGLKFFLSEVNSRFRLQELKLFDVIDELKKESFLSRQV